MWHPWAQLVGVPIAQLAETSSGGDRQYGSGILQDVHDRGRSFFHSVSRIAYSCAGEIVVRVITASSVFRGPDFTVRPGDATGPCC